jgi:hypothetical protein
MSNTAGSAVGNDMGVFRFEAKYDDTNELTIHSCRFENPDLPDFSWNVRTQAFTFVNCIFSKNLPEDIPINGNIDGITIDSGLNLPVLPAVCMTSTFRPSSPISMTDVFTRTFQMYLKGSQFLIESLFFVMIL